MTMLLRANTAVDVLIGPFIDETDGKTAETGLTITQADVRLSKNGQNMAQKNDANAAAHDELGYHNCPLSTTDTDTEGQLLLAVHEGGALPIWHEYNVIAEAAWDSLFAAKDVGFMDVNIKTVGRADAQETEADNLESACAAYDANRGLTGNALPGAAADAAGGVPISDDGGHDLDELYDAIVTDAAGANIAVDIIAVKAETALIVADTGELQVDDYPTSIAAVQTTVDAIETIVDTNAAGADIAADIIALKAETALIVADTSELQVDDYPTSIAAVQAAADAIIAIVDTAAAGADIAADIIALKAETALILADTGELQTDDIPTLIAALPTAAEIWDATEAITGDTHSFETILARLYMFLQHKMNITDADGSVALRNTADDGDVMTQSITDNDTTTVRTEGAWV